MRLRIYNTAEPFVNEKGEEMQAYYFTQCFRNKETKELVVKNICVFSNPGYNVGDFVEVSKSRRTNNYFIANKKEK